MADTKRERGDKTGARDPNLKPEDQGFTQDDANRMGDLNDPANKVELARQRMESGIPMQGQNPEPSTAHDPPEAGEHGGAQEQPDPASSGQTGGGNPRQGQQASREDRSGKPKE